VYALVLMYCVYRIEQTLTSELEALQAARTELAGGKGASPHDEKVFQLFFLLTATLLHCTALHCTALAVINTQF
jgi:hypothetical protein